MELKSVIWWSPMNWWLMADNKFSKVFLATAKQNTGGHFNGRE